MTNPAQQLCVCLYSRWQVNFYIYLCLWYCFWYYGMQCKLFLWIPVHLSQTIKVKKNDFTLRRITMIVCTALKEKVTLNNLKFTQSINLLCLQMWKRKRKHTCHSYLVWIMPSGLSPLSELLFIFNLWTMLERHTIA